MTNRRSGVKAALLGLGVLTVAAGVAYAIVLRPMRLRFKQVGNLVDMRGYEWAIRHFHETHASFPLSLPAVLEEARQLSAGERFAKGLDGWGHPVLYRSNGEQYLLVSYGRDGRPDGTDYVQMRAAGRWDNGPCSDPDADIIFSDRGEHRTCGK